MRAFTYERVTTPQAAAQAASVPGAKFIAGGTNLLDLMKLQIETPTHLVDVNHVGLDKIDPTDDGGVRIGALVRNSDLAADPTIRKDYPVLSRAILAGASGQIRNKATTAGNLLQRTRCPYFYETAMPCNKRSPGSGCAAIGGLNRASAILGVSDDCIATHPSDMAVAMRALDAIVETISPSGLIRSIPVKDLHRLPEASPERDTTLAPGEMITAVTLPKPLQGIHSYRKIRERASFAFANVSIASIYVKDGDRITQCRLAFGGLSHKPWRVEQAEPAAIEDSAGAADAVLADARTTPHNAYKIPLTRRLIAASLIDAKGGQ